MNDDCDVIKVTVGATRRELRIIYENEQGIQIDVSGGAVRLQGTSADLPGVKIDVAGTIFADPVRGPVGRWTQLGGAAYVTIAMLAGKKSATFELQSKFTDSTGLDDWTPPFHVEWHAPPVMP